MRRVLAVTAISAMTLAGACSMFGQTGGPARGEDFQITTAIPFGMGGPEDRAPVKGIPLAADIVTAHVQTLADGNKITNEDTSHFYRDSEGRTRRENKLTMLGQSGDAPSMIMINDPVAHTRFVLNTMHKSADVLMSAEGPAAPGNVMYMKKTQDERVVVTGGTASASAETKEDLGTQTIEGMVAHGTRASHVIPAGKIGNERPITVTTESWYSDEIGMEVLRVHNDPWSGEMTTKVTNVRRGEPDASLFTPPADYKVEKGKHVIRIEKAAPLPPPAPPQD
jgi:hypothetical protein